MIKKYMSLLDRMFFKGIFNKIPKWLKILISIIIIMFMGLGLLKKRVIFNGIVFYYKLINIIFLIFLISIICYNIYLLNILIDRNNNWRLYKYLPFSEIKKHIKYLVEIKNKDEINIYKHLYMTNIKYYFILLIIYFIFIFVCFYFYIL